MVGANMTKMAVMPLPHPTTSMATATSANLHQVGHVLIGVTLSPAALGPTA
jgi:hypothetical protein